VGTAHHEAGHAVAAVLRGGEVLHVLVGDPTDEGLIDAEREWKGVVRHRSMSWDVPFIAFAGPWAQWRIGTETGYDTGYDTDEFWTRVDIWAGELEHVWPAIRAVAALALSGDPVDTGVIQVILGDW
jgi:hypothetical protein